MSDKKQLKRKSSTHKKTVVVNSEDDNADVSKTKRPHLHYSNDTLPNEVLLEIFDYLSIKDLCQAASVCKRWNCIAHDRTLWLHMDLSKINLSLKTLWKFIRQRYTSYATSITIDGLNNREFKGKLDKIVSPAFMKKLKDSCPHLNSVRFKHIDLNSITVQDLPIQIEKLSLIRCEITLNWFLNNNLNSLQYLDLSNSARICTTHLKDLVKNCNQNLQQLILTNCYRIADSSLDLLTKEFLNLNLLKINGTKCTSLSVHWICNRLKFIDVLDVRDCKDVNKNDIQFILETFQANKNFRLIS